MTKKELVAQLADIKDDAKVEIDCPGIGYMLLKGLFIRSAEGIVLYVE